MSVVLSRICAPSANFLHLKLAQMQILRDLRLAMLQSQRLMLAQ